MTKLRVAGFSLRIENIRITLCDDPEHIALDRDGEAPKHQAPATTLATSINVS